MGCHNKSAELYVHGDTLSAILTLSVKSETNSKYLHPANLPSAQRCGIILDITQCKVRKTCIPPVVYNVSMAPQYYT